MADLKQRIEEFLVACGVELGRGTTPKLRCPNPGHADEHPSAVLYRDSQRVFCPVCAQSWDVFDVAGLLNGVAEYPRRKEIVERTLGETHDDGRGPAPTTKKAKPQTTNANKAGKPVALTTEDARKTYSGEEIGRRAERAGWGEIIAWWPYRDAEGLVVGMDVRFERTEGKARGKKTIVTFWFDGRSIQTTNPPALLSNLDLLAQHPHRPALIVEGMKTAEAAEKIPGFIPVSWNGGTAKVDRPDWSPLANRRVYIYPDDDRQKDNSGREIPWHRQPGMKAALAIKKYLPKAKIVRPYEAARTVKASGADIVEALEVATPEELARYILESPEVVPEIQVDGSPAGREWAKRLLQTDKGTPKITVANLLLIFQHDEAWSLTLAFNARTQCVVFRRDPPEELHAKAGDVLTDEHITHTSVWLQDHYGFGLKSTGIVHSAIVAAAHLHSFDPVREWLETLVWDGTPRVDSWLSDVTGCPQNVYTSEVGAKVLISMVARVYRPGCKVDTVLVLLGPQGSLKSSLLAELAMRPEWFSDHISDIGGKDAAMGLCGPWILEFSELDAITGKRESERVKAWITQQRDRFRPPYGRDVVDVPRRTVFCGTSNLQQFLRDETGGRRFLPIEIQEIDLEALRAMREQLWAEARARFLGGEEWWLRGEALQIAKVEQEDRRVADPWEHAIRSWLASPAAHGRTITSSVVLSDGIKMPIERQTKSDLDRCGRILGTVLGWVRAFRRVDGVGVKAWLPPRREGEQEVISMSPARSVAIGNGESENNDW